MKFYILKSITELWVYEEVVRVKKYYRAIFQNSFKIFEFCGRFHYVKFVIFYNVFSFQIIPNSIFKFYIFYSEGTPICTNSSLIKPESVPI